MDATFAGRGRARISTLPSIYDDPLDPDAATDLSVPTTRRALIRLALVAAETGARFQRDGIAHDPMNWLLAPRNLFHGESAIDACLRREGCLRGLLVQALSLGLDADPDAVDALAPGREHDALRPIVADADQTTPAGLNAGVAQLFTATVVARRGLETVQAFHASIATAKAEIVDRLLNRIGTVAINARIVAGLNVADPLVQGLVSPDLCATLTLIAADPLSPLAAGLNLNIEQRSIA
jgi:hypothetical protein